MTEQPKTPSENQVEGVNNIPDKLPLNGKQKWSWRKKPLVIIYLFLLLGIGLGGGYLQFVYATVRCGRLPVAATNFAAANSFTLPGERGYGPNPFHEYFCTRGEAEKAYFVHSSLNDLGAKEQEQRWKSEQERRKFSPEKVDFKVYSPSIVPDRFRKTELELDESQVHQTQVFQNLVIGEVDIMVEFRQARLEDGGWVCSLRSCVEISSDIKGRKVFKSHSDNNGTDFWGVQLEENRYFNIEATERSKLTDQEAIQILGSLQAVN